MSKVIKVDDVVALIKDGATVGASAERVNDCETGLVRV
jgi:acyl CoA:acetate/3-ketoacid CoA transferase